MLDLVPMEAPLLLLVEDDDALAQLTIDYLQGHGCKVTRAADGRRGLSEALRSRYDVVLLDLMLPGMDGFDVCRELRAKSDTPIIVLTARKEEADRVLGLELGADDYVLKPFSARELLARIRALMRRSQGISAARGKTISSGGLVLDPLAMRATIGGRDLSLTAYEFSLLKTLAERPGQVLSREQLMELAKGSADESFDRSIDVHIFRLRQKLGDDSKSPRLLRTVRGVGYSWAGGDA